LTLAARGPIFKRMLQVEHADPALELLERDPSQDTKWPKGVGKKFRWVMQQIRIVDRKNQLYQFGSLRLKKLERPGDDEAMWLNDQWRLEMLFSGEPPNEKVVILRITNHYKR
jgi:plasmid maintenance system killer protein